MPNQRNKKRINKKMSRKARRIRAEQRRDNRLRMRIERYGDLKHVRRCNKWWSKVFRRYKKPNLTREEVIEKFGGLPKIVADLDNDGYTNEYLEKIIWKIQRHIIPSKKQLNYLCSPDLPEWLNPRFHCIDRCVEENKKTTIEWLFGTGLFDITFCLIACKKSQLLIDIAHEHGMSMRQINALLANRRTAGSYYDAVYCRCYCGSDYGWCIHQDDEDEKGIVSGHVLDGHDELDGWGDVYDFMYGHDDGMVFETIHEFHINVEV